MAERLQEDHPQILCGVCQGFDFHWRTVRGKNNLLFCLIESGEGMEEFFLCRFLTCDKLNIVNKKYVCGAVFVFKSCRVLITESLDKLVYKILALFINDIKLRMIFLYVIYKQNLISL